LLALSSAIALSLALAGAPAFAQDDEDEEEPAVETVGEDEEEAEAGEPERILVTGSRIPRQDFTANSPIITVGEELFDSTGAVGFEAIINELPQVIPFFETQSAGETPGVFTNVGVSGGAVGGITPATGGSQFAASGFQSNSAQTPGSANVNLRGLGSGRNLVLVDGRRMTPTNATMSVDTNSIPGAAIQRVEVVSGGASAVYGADAIAGVVNTILKDNFEGATFRTRHSITEVGDGAEFSVSGLFGASTADKKGNLMFGVEHATRSSGDYADRDWWVEERMNPYFGGNELGATNVTDTAINFGTFANYNNNPAGISIKTTLGAGAAGTAGRACLPGGGTTASTTINPDTGLPYGANCQEMINSLFPSRPADPFPELVYVDTDNGDAATGRPRSTTFGQASYEPFLSSNGIPATARSASGSGHADSAGLYNIPINNFVFINRNQDDPTRQIYTNSTTNLPLAAGAVSNYNGPLDGLIRKRTASGGIAQNREENPISVPLERFSLFGRGRYSITESIDAVAFGTFGRTRTTTTSGPTYAGSFWGAVVPHGNEIYAPSRLANGATDPRYVAGGSYGLNCPAQGGCTESQVWPFPEQMNKLLSWRTFSNGTSAENVDVAVDRVLDFLPPRQTRNRMSTFNIRFGLEGELLDDWVWDASLTHGQSEQVTELVNFVNVQRWRGVMTSPNFGRAFTAVGNPLFNSGSRNGFASCTTGLPIVEDFEVSQDCIDAITVNLVQNGLMEQSTFEANLTGDILELPAGPLQFALGATYRENDYDYINPGDLVGTGNFTDLIAGLSPVGDTHGYISVGEAYGELLVPVVRDLPFIQAFDLELGGRISDYSNAEDNVDTFKVLGDWTILSWARLRGGYNRATRAPNIQEMFLGRTTSTFLGGSFGGDPCSTSNYLSQWSAAVVPSGTGTQPLASAEQAAFTEAVCREMMGAEPAEIYYSENRGNGSLGITYISGNPDVKPETAHTYTIGFVVTSPSDNPWLRGLSGSIDYFQIELHDAINDPGVDNWVNQCFDLDPDDNGTIDGVSDGRRNGAATAETPAERAQSDACRQLQRDPSNGTGFTVDTIYSNDGYAELEGVDLNLSWRGDFADLGAGFIPGGGGLSVLATFPVKAYTVRGATALEWQGSQACGLGLSCGGSDYNLSTTASWFNEGWNASLRWTHVPPARPVAWVTNRATTQEGQLKPTDLYSLSGGYQMSDLVSLQFGVENLFDEPPYLNGGTGANLVPNSTAPSAVIPNFNVGLPITAFPTPPSRGGGDFLGRRFFVGLTANF
jgi:outer membrane receptor protein involved in Fe transport